MTDYKEEQANELEALESIYPDELTIISLEPFPCFQLPIKAEFDDGLNSEAAACMLQFTYTAKYPDEPPGMEIVDLDDLDLEEEHVNLITRFMAEQAQENLGMSMVFTLVSETQERLNVLLEEIVTTRVEEAERKKKEEEEAEQRRFDGIRVTIETFLAWKTKFDAEIEEERRRKGLNTKNNQKLTGKELFLTDATLDDSDMKFLEDDDEDAVQVDESLFEDLDDLDIDDELDIEDDG